MATKKPAPKKPAAKKKAAPKTKKKLAFGVKDENGKILMSKYR